MSLRAAILAFLEIEPTTGYTLQARFAGSVGDFWSTTQSQVYRELKALEAEGLVVVGVERGDGRPDRKVCTPTALGLGVLREWLLAPLEPLQLRHPLLLKLVFAADVEVGVFDGILRAYLDKLLATRIELQRRSGAAEIFSLARSPRERVLWELSLEHGLAWCDVEIAWVRRARRRLGAVSTAKKRATAKSATATTKPTNNRKKS